MFPPLSSKKKTTPTLKRLLGGSRDGYVFDPLLQSSHHKQSTSKSPKAILVVSEGNNHGNTTSPKKCKEYTPLTTPNSKKGEETVYTADNIEEKAKNSKRNNDEGKDDGVIAVMSTTTKRGSSGLSLASKLTALNSIRLSKPIYAIDNDDDGDFDDDTINELQYFGHAPSEISLMAVVDDDDDDDDDDDNKVHDHDTAKLLGDLCRSCEERKEEEEDKQTVPNDAAVESRMMCQSNMIQAPAASIHSSSSLHTDTNVEEVSIHLSTCSFSSESVRQSNNDFLPNYYCNTSTKQGIEVTEMLTYLEESQNFDYSESEQQEETDVEEEKSNHCNCEDNEANFESNKSSVQVEDTESVSESSFFHYAVTPSTQSTQEDVNGSNTKTQPETKQQGAHSCFKNFHETEQDATNTTASFSSNFSTSWNEDSNYNNNGMTSSTTTFDPFHITSHTDYESHGFDHPWKAHQQHQTGGKATYANKMISTQNKCSRGVDVLPLCRIPDENMDDNMRYIGITATKASAGGVHIPPWATKNATSPHDISTQSSSRSYNNKSKSVLNIPAKKEIVFTPLAGDR